ncbi:MAG: 50S ribosomal protein L4 [Candidatus Brocadiia bacterium]
MIEVPLYNQEGKEIERLKIDETVFGERINRPLLNQVVRMYEVTMRRGTASTKTRGEVEGSTRKPWKQKHTGRARSGTARSPIWRHGGITFGPKPRNYSFPVPQKMRQIALNHAILSKLKDNETLVIDKLQAENPKTKPMALMLKNMGVSKSCLIGIKDINKNLHLSTRNIDKVTMMPIKDFNAYEVIKHQRLVLTRESLSGLIEKAKVK